jgi:hypothetical protein
MSPATIRTMQDAAAVGAAEAKSIALCKIADAAKVIDINDQDAVRELRRMAHVRSLSHDIGCHTEAPRKNGRGKPRNEKGHTTPARGIVRPGGAVRRWLCGFLHVICHKKRENLGIRSTYLMTT